MVDDDDDMSFFDENGEPRARWTDPETSHEAAASVKNIRLFQLAVVKTLGEMRRGCDEEIGVWYHHDIRLPKQSPSGLRTRRKELLCKEHGRNCTEGHGYVEWTGDWVVLKSGRRGRVWQLTDRGRRLYERLDGTSFTL